MTVQVNVWLETDVPSVAEMVTLYGLLLESRLAMVPAIRPVLGLMLKPLGRPVALKVSVGIAVGFHGGLQDDGIAFGVGLIAGAVECEAADVPGEGGAGRIAAVGGRHRHVVGRGDGSGVGDGAGNQSGVGIDAQSVGQAASRVDQG